MNIKLFNPGKKKKKKLINSYNYPNASLLNLNKKNFQIFA